MPGPPKVSVLIPAYNAERFIAEALDSALSQDYPNFEIVVSDDGSTDRTPEIVASYAERFPTRIVSVREEQNRGTSSAMNRAFEVHSGELCAQLDADDVMLPGKLSKQVTMLEREPDAVGCVHDAEVFDAATGRVLGRFSEVISGQPMREGGVELWFDPTYKMLPSATMYRSSARPPHGFDNRIWIADWLFDIEVFRHGRVVVLDEVLVRYRRHSTSLSRGLQSSGLDFEEGMMVLGIVESRYPELEGKVKTGRAALLLGEARRRVRRGDRGGALRFAVAAVRGGGLGGLIGLTRDVALAGWRRRRG